MAVLSFWHYAVTAAVAAVLLTYNYVSRKNSRLAHVPNIRFKGSNSIRRYLFEADQLLHEGYVNVSISIPKPCSRGVC